MTPQDYITAGYEIGAQKSQSEVNKAESDVMAAYILPILPTASVEDCTVRDCVMCLAWLLICQRNLVATRGGVRIKSGASSINASGADVLQQGAIDAHAHLVSLRKMTGAIKDAEVTDICKIYFKSNYLYL